MSHNLLTYLNHFVRLSPDEFAELYTQLETRSFQKGEQVTRIGKQEEYMYFILTGLVRKYFLKDKEEIITYIAKEGNIVGSAVSFLSGKASKYIIEALEPTTTLAISRQKLEALYKKNNKWERVARIISSHYFIVLEQRFLDNIRFSMYERFIHFINENPDLLARVPQKYLASYLNIKPETFSRLKKNLKSQMIMSAIS